VRCPGIAALWEALPEWERLGEEVKASGFDMPDWVRVSALEKLVPADLLGSLVGRPELDTYGRKVHWVKCQMEHSRGMLKARAVVGGSKKDAGGDTIMNELAKADGDDAAPGLSPQVWSLQDQITYMGATLQALAKGKGKGKAGGGKAGGKSGTKGEVFDGTCHHCGKYGHRQNACRQLDKLMADKGKGKGKGLRELSAEEDEAGAVEDEAEGSEDWVLGPKLWAVSKESGRALLPHGCRNPPVTARLSSNQFACLECADDGAEEGEDTEAPAGAKAPEYRIFSGACSVFVQNLDRQVDDQALHACFSLLGDIAACKVAGGVGNSRGYGFVHYETQEAAQLAIEQINGLLIGATTVEVKPCKGAMVRRQVGGAPSGTTFAHHQTVQAAQQAVARAAGPATKPAACAGGPRTVTFGDCIAAAAPARSQRRPARAFDCNAAGEARQTVKYASIQNTHSRWQPSLDGGAAAHQACLVATRAALAARRAEAALGSLQRDLPGSLVGAVARESGMVEAVVDSGAEESVAPPGFFAAAMVPSPMSKAGGKYRAANGTRIRNLGQQQVAFTSAEGHKCAMPFQVAEVERPLISVAQLTSAGNSVVLSDTGGQIVNAATGKTIELVRRGGVYLLLMNMGIGVASGFPRQGK
jgi:hypothetical protein